MNLFSNKENDEQKHSKYDLAVSVLNSDENWVQLPGFDISVAEALSIILEKLHLPLEADGDKRMKYFLYRSSSASNDGFDILAEYDKHGSPIILDEYGIHNGIKLFVGAIVLPTITKDAEIQFNSNNEINYNDDDEILEI